MNFVPCLYLFLVLSPVIVRNLSRLKRGRSFGFVVTFVRLCDRMHKYGSKLNPYHNDQKQVYFNTNPKLLRFLNLHHKKKVADPEFFLLRSSQVLINFSIHRWLTKGGCKEKIQRIFQKTIITLRHTNSWFVFVINIIK